MATIKSFKADVSSVSLLSDFSILVENRHLKFFYLQVRKYFQGWNPLVNPLHGLEVMVRWREILERKEAENSAFSLTLAQGTAHGEEAYV